MKKIVSVFFIALILVSCGGSGKNKSVDAVIATNDLSQMKAKKKDIEKKQLEIANELDQLNDAISKIDSTKRLSQITTFKTKEEVFTHYLELQGNVSTKQNLVIFPEYSGVLSSVYVKEGQKVAKGQLLAKIDDGGLSQQLAQLQIQADLAKTTFERQQRLWNQKIGSEIQYLQAKSTYEAQAKAVTQMQSQLAKTEVRAPFSGTIDDIITEQGSVVAPGQSQLMRIVNLRDMYIETAVPESYLTSVTKGKAVKVIFPVLGNKTIDAKIRQAGSFINPANRTFKIEVAVPNMDGLIKPNLTAKLQINDYTSEKAILIPQSVISENAQGEQYVYVVENIENNIGKTKRVIIETGKPQGDVIEITGEKIVPGMEIVEEGARSVKEGQTVEIISE